MSFINEYISPEDYEKYRLSEVDDRFGGAASEQWTIDRNRAIYLRVVHRGREEFCSQTTWSFYWKGTLLTLRLDLLDHRGARGEPGWSHWELVRLNGSHGLPENLKEEKDLVLKDLQEALTTYKGFGVFSKNTDYSITLDIAGECQL